MANRYSVAGRSAATAATADHVAGQLWNPASAKSIYVREVWVFTTAGTTMNFGLARSSARGATPTTTVTPDADNAFDRRATPPSASVLELATFGTQPTLALPYLARAISAAVQGAGWVFVFPEPIEVPSGTGLCVTTTQAAAFPASEIVFVWDE